MPIYLLHGFRWPRQAVRVHTILNNIDDAAPEWLMSSSSSRAIFENLTTNHPDIMKNLPMLRFVEQYNPDDISHAALSQPFVYVADRVEVNDLSISVEEMQAKGIPTGQWDSLVELRDKLAPEEKIGWWAVYCGDEKREIGSSDRAGGWREEMEEQKLGNHGEEVSVAYKRWRIRRKQASP